MNNLQLPAMNPDMDLLLERRIPVSPERVWRAWTVPADLMPWFCPRPWRVTDCQIDLRPGGQFFTVMEGPNGERFENMGCYLEVDAPNRLVWTGALDPDYRPKDPEEGGILFTAYLTFEPDGDGTLYRAFVVHSNAEGRQQHEEMGFHQGWGRALDQLVELAQGQ